jgi:hypothetical protein
MSTRASRLRAASARFFLGVGRETAPRRIGDERSLPLFSTELIMDAEGLLAHGARALVDKAANSHGKAVDEIAGMQVRGQSIGIACRHETAVEAHVRAGFVCCPECGGPAMFMYRGKAARASAP